MPTEIIKENHQPNKTTKSVQEEFVTKLDQSIQKIIAREGFITYKIDKKCLSADGGNYLATLYEIDVKGRTKDDHKELNIFVKNTINPDTVKVISITDVYNTELFAYKELSKVLNELQENANIPAEERYNMVKAYEESSTEAIIMENLIKKGFKTLPRLEVMNLDFMKIAVKQLARFHGLSFVLREKRPDYFNEKIKSIKHFFDLNEHWKEMVKSVSDSVMAHIDEKYKAKIRKFYENLSEKYQQNIFDESIHVCLCHGDYRPNNIMTKISEGKVEEIIPVDYQLLHYGCPVFDFIYLLVLSTDREFRKAHTSDLKELYYETLKEFLRYFDLDVNLVYPKEDFERVYKEKFDQGLLIGLLYLPFILSTEDGFPDLGQEDSTFSFCLHDKFKDRIHGLIEEYVEAGCI